MYREHAALSYGWEAAVYVQASRLKTAAPFFLGFTVINSHAASFIWRKLMHEGDDDRFNRRNTERIFRSIPAK